MIKIPTKLYIIGIMLLGITSGTTLNLVIFTIPYHLSEAGYGVDYIGMIFLAATPYCLKPLYAPFIDRYSIPFLCKKFGQRRGWALGVQICLAGATSMLLLINPSDDLWITTYLISIIAFFASVQDIILDAYRIERPSNSEELSIATTFNVIGLRIGMLMSGAGALFLSYISGWEVVYIGAFAITLIGPVTILHLEEPSVAEKRHVSRSFISWRQYFRTLTESIFALKKSQPKWSLIMLMILLYKVSDSVPMAMSGAFFMDLSFTSYDIGTISKFYGLIIMIFGCTVGGYLSSKIGIKRSLLICGVIQLLSPIMFMILALVGHNMQMFITAVTIQNFASGLGGTALFIYLSSLCNSEFVATQFSMISSFNSLSRIGLSSVSGLIAGYVEWWEFFLYSGVLGSGFILVFWLVGNEYFNQSPFPQDRDQKF